MNKAWLIALLVLVAVSGNVTAQNMPSRDQLPGGWTQISPGGDTICGHGAPYSFYYRKGSGQNLVIDFQGGGMCWNGQTCSPTKDTTFDDSINPGDPSDNPALFPVGITDFNNPQNPFLNDDMLYVDYCTGDFDTGNKDQGYTYNNTYYDVKHKGYVDAGAALNWAYTNIPAPESVFVTGCSAGSVGAAYWSADIKAHYPNQPVTLLGDSGGGWRGIPGATWNLWGSSYQGATGSKLSIPLFYEGAAREGVHIAQYNTAADETQTFFTNVGFSSVPYPTALSQDQRDIASRAGNFRYYTEGGSLHCIIPRAEFYSYQTNGISVRSWVEKLADNQPVNNVVCTECAEPEIIGQPTPTASQ